MSQTPAAIHPVRLQRLAAIAGFFPEVSAHRDPFPSADLRGETIVRTKITWQPLGRSGKPHAMTVFSLFVTPENRAAALAKHAALSAQFMRVWKAARARQTRSERLWRAKVAEQVKGVALATTPVAEDSAILRVINGTQEVLLIPQVASTMQRGDAPWWRYYSLASRQHPQVSGARTSVANLLHPAAATREEALNAALTALALPIAERAIAEARQEQQSTWQKEHRSEILAATKGAAGDASFRH